MSTPILNPEVEFNALPPETQRLFGLVGFALALAWMGQVGGQEYGDMDVERRFEDTAGILTGALLNTLTDCVPNIDDIHGRPIDLNPLGIRTCTTCGCTHTTPCEGGCSWVGPTLCSACAPPATEPADG